MLGGRGSVLPAPPFCSAARLSPPPITCQQSTLKDRNGTASIAHAGNRTVPTPELKSAQAVRGNVTGCIEFLVPSK